jgi:hypothetical protein
MEYDLVPHRNDAAVDFHGQMVDEWLRAAKQEAFLERLLICLELAGMASCHTETV